jgi:hypothetical protein
MTKEHPMTNTQTLIRMEVDSSSGFRHVFVMRASTFVAWLLTLAISGYQLTISPALTLLFGAAGGCRFTPSCSEYAIRAIRARGALAGSWLALKRIGRCHPWGGHGHDPAPERELGI